MGTNQKSAENPKEKRRRIIRRRIHHSDEAVPFVHGQPTVINRKNLPEEERQALVNHAAETVGNRQLQKQLSTVPVQLSPERERALTGSAATRSVAGAMIGAVTGLSTPTSTVSETDKTEFELLKKKIADPDVESYVKHREAVFGSSEAYTKYAAIADAELDSTKGLRRVVELSKEPAAQTILYRWLRKAYETKAGVSDVPGLIKQGMSKELKSAIDKVKSAYGKSFRYGGFNPRPMKNAKYKFRLGTVSEHGLGKAVDIEAKKNPILSKEDWQFIETLTGKTVDRKKERWQEEPEELWKDVADLNQRFVKKLKEEVERIEKERAAATLASGKVKTAKKPKEPLDEILEKHKALKKYQDGFFTLEWNLVKALHENGFTWGATFGNAVDLHHFEL